MIARAKEISRRQFLVAGVSVTGSFVIGPPHWGQAG